MKRQRNMKLSLNKAINEKPLVVSEAFFQILNLMISIFAFSFLVAAVSAVASPTVTAQTSQVCCEKVKDKNIFCQNSLLSDCDTSFSHAQTLCSSTDYCKLGCCYDSKEGTCAENTPKKVCDLRNGTWNPRGDCSISQCQKGCCVLGDQSLLTNLVRCKKLASYYGLETDFKSGVTIEASCIALAQSSDRGACVISAETETTCKITTKSECKSITHNESAFYKGLLCSAEELGTPCARQHHTGCIEGKDEVYWFDSCGNAENIYDTDKERSWNNGKILDKKDSCNPGKGNVKDLLCGNCQYSKGSMCGKVRQGIEPKPAYGDYICRDLDCHNTYNGKDYKHGESWCVSDYNVAVGQGKDAVGSRHWRHICLMGEEKVEPCDDYRQGICVEGKIEVGNSIYNEASCRANDWRSCLDYSTKSNAEKLCKDNPDCYWYLPWKVSICLPQVPSGFDLKQSSVASAFCGMATMECPVVYVKQPFGGWECKQNCECKEQNWVDQMNKWCTSLGDCGGKYNIAGKYTTDGYTISGTSNKPSKESSGSGSGSGLMGGMSSLLPTAISVGGAYLGSQIVQGALTKALTQTITTSLLEKGITLEAPVISEVVKTAVQGPITDVGANIAKGLVDKAGGAVSEAVAKEVGTVGQSTANQGLQLGTKTSMSLANTLSTIISVAAFAISVYFLAKSFGFSTGQAIGIAVASVAVALAIKMIFFKVMSFAKFFGWAGIIIALLMFLLSWLLGWGKQRTETITFTCLAWQPPSGGEDCEKCNVPPIGGEMRQCSKYRCDSLGAACSLLNEGTGNETCIWLNKNDRTSPTIKPWQDVLTSGHSYKDVTDCPTGSGCWRIERTNTTKGCIQPFIPLQFGIETNEPSQCRVDTNHTSTFDEMQFFFGENLYLYNHSMQMSLPSPAAVDAYFGSPQIQNSGEYTLYLRCRDANGNWNSGESVMEFCVDPSPDMTAPLLMGTSIENGAPISYGASSVPLDIFLNEPSECKWSRTDQEYKSMENSFSCTLNISQMELDMTYKCSTTLTGIEDNTANKFYFRCKDQPWLAGGVNESDRNVNTESYEFILQGTSPLEIINAEPTGIISYGSEPIPVYLRVETAGGYAGGESTCFFSEQGYDNMIEFFITGLYSNIHEQRLELAEGNYTYYILCRDLAGNIDETTVSFTAELDRKAPSIIRAYQDGGMLKIVTDEESECRYGIKDCNFDFLSATDMPFANSTEHTAEWRTDATYYIKCMDNYGNMPPSSQCSMQVNAYDVFENP